MYFIIDSIFPPRDTELLVRSACDDALHTLMRPHVIAVGSYTAIGLLPYAHPLVQACVIEAKFHGNLRATHLLSEVLREYLLEYVEDTRELRAGELVLTPIPLSRARMRERGYNQTERIAHIASATLRDQLTLLNGVMVRARNTVPQTSLTGAGRRENMKGAFSVQGTLHPLHTYLLLDDVLTTGATMQEAAQTLEKSGVRSISMLTLAH